MHFTCEQASLPVSTAGRCILCAPGMKDVASVARPQVRLISAAAEDGTKGLASTALRPDDPPGTKGNASTLKDPVRWPMPPLI